MDRSVKKQLPNVQVTENNLIQYVQKIAEVVVEMRAVLNRDVGELVEVSADYECLESDWVVVVNSGGGAIAVTLPSASRIARPIFITNPDGGVITVEPQTGETISGGASDTIGAGEVVTMYFANDDDWIILNEY